MTSTLQALFLLVPTTTLYTKRYYYYPYFTDKEGDPERLSAFPRAPWLTGRGARVERRQCIPEPQLADPTPLVAPITGSC